jgi:hypothetical protein
MIWRALHRERMRHDLLVTEPAGSSGTRILSALHGLAPILADFGVDVVNLAMTTTFQGSVTFNGAGIGQIVVNRAAPG